MPDYPSNISRAQFALIQPDLENFRKHTRPRRYDLYDVFNAILYSLTIGCQWRELPHDFPEWHTVYRYYDMWRDKPDPTADSLLERLLINISRKSRDFSHGMDRPLLSPFRGLFVCFCIFLVIDIFLDNFFAHITQCTHIVTRRPKMTAPILATSYFWMIL